MSIWIRSQDKEKLVKSDKIQIDVEYVIELKKNFISIISLDNSNNYCILGYYSTKEKALNVLDMIEKKIIENNTIVCNEKDWARCVGIRNCVFQMPQDDEVK